MAIETITAPLTAQQARELTDEVRSDVANLWLKVLILYEGAAHAALDYPSWHEYWETEFGGEGSRGNQYITAGRVCRVLARAGLPLPTNDATARALSPVMRSQPEKVVEIWKVALEESGGKPTGVQVKRLAEPFRQKKQRHLPRSADGRTIRAMRHGVGGNLRDARTCVGEAHAAIAAALATRPADTLVRDWISQAQAIAEEVDLIVAKLAAANFANAIVQGADSSE